ncbi:MFS transporter [Ruegeria atlantica]|uniref:MFS transporter n=1 Tax=Ruegeria atlantica TaxID=81569 RepID=UPI00147FC137|nr:MFS transporter [Ruegeria atlantica]
MMEASQFATHRPVHPVVFLILTIGMTSVTYGFGRYAFGLFLPVLRDDFAATTFELGAIASVNAATYLISTLLASAVAIYFRPTIMMTMASAITVIGLFIAGLSPEFSGVACGIITAGIGGGILSPALFEAIEHWLPEAWKVKAIGAVSAGATPGMIITALAAYIAADTWRMAWITMAIVGLVVIMFSLMILPRDSISRSSVVTKVPISWGLFVKREHLRLYFALLVYGILFSVYLTFSVDLLKQVGNMVPPHDRLFWALLGVAGLPAIFNGLAISSVGLRWFLRLIFTACALSYALLALAPTHLGAVLVSAVLFGYTSIAIGSGLLVWSISKFKERPSLGSGAVFFLFSSTTIVGPTLFSALLPLMGSTSIFVALAALSMLMVPLSAPERNFQ